MKSALKIIIGIVIILITIVAFIVYRLFLTNQDLPLPVKIQYELVKIDLSNSKPYVSIAKCSKDKETIYDLAKNDGIHGTNYYFKENGDPIGQSQWADIFHHNLLIDTNKYECHLIIENSQRK